MSDQEILEAIFLLDDDAPAMDIANEIGAPVPDVKARLQELTRTGMVDQTGKAFALTEVGMDQLEQLTA